MERIPVVVGEYRDAATLTVMLQMGSIDSASAACSAGVSEIPAGLARILWTISVKMLSAISSGVSAPMSTPAGYLTLFSASGQTPLPRR